MLLVGCCLWRSFFYRSFFVLAALTAGCIGEGNIVGDSVEPGSLAGISPEIWECRPEGNCDFLKEILLILRFPPVSGTEPS